VNDPTNTLATVVSNDSKVDGGSLFEFCEPLGITLHADNDNGSKWRGRIVAKTKG
jgi:hypothetical protein